MGGLYELGGERELAALDEKEGHGWAYRRQLVRVLLGASAEQHDAFAYAVIEPDGAHVPPSREYVQAVLGGARERGLPSAYVAMLAGLAEARAEGA